MPVAASTGADAITTDGGCCPFIRNPDPDCHCYNLGNPEISSFMYFCGRNYKYCDRYQRRIQGSDTPPKPVFY